MNPLVYAAGPIDYVEHRMPGPHQQENWRHRFFGELPIRLLCPICMNRADSAWEQVMTVNAAAMEAAQAMVAYFPGDTATFGTPIEVADWCVNGFALNRHDRIVLVHPAPQGMFVRMYRERYGLTVVRTFEEARSWLRRRLTLP